MERRINMETTIDRIGSIGVHAVTTITAPAMIAATDPSTSESTCNKAPRVFIDDEARERTHADTRFASRPAMAIDSTAAPATGAGSSNRRTASTVMNTTRPSSASALTNAARTSARA